MNDDQFKKLVVDGLDDLSDRMKHVEQQLSGLQTGWAKLVGAAAVVGTVAGWLADEILSWVY